MYNPYAYNYANANWPQAAQQPQPQQNQSGIQWVQGEAGAKSFLVAPGQAILLMDSEAQQFFIKSADQSGMPQPLRVFTYQEVTHGRQTAMQDMSGYVTREELETRLAALTGKEGNANE